MKSPKVSVVLGTYSRKKFLQLAISTIRQEVKSLAAELIVIDGGSDDGSLGWLAKQKDIILVVQHNRTGKDTGANKKSWGYFMNLGFKIASGKYVCMLSDDCLVVPGAICNAVRLFDRLISKNKKVGAIAFYWRNWPTEEKYHVGLTLGDNVFVNHGLYLNSALRDVNYIDQVNYNFYHADGDLCLKMIEKGYKIVVSEDSYIEHFAYAKANIKKSNFRTQPKDWKNYLKRWKGIFYNPKDKKIGGWLTKSYSDPQRTYLKYLRFLPINKILPRLL
jgi:GT2 family glycosyltransferase